LVRSQTAKAIARRFEDAYEAMTGSMPSIFASRPAGGARVIS